MVNHHEKTLFGRNIFHFFPFQRISKSKCMNLEGSRNWSQGHKIHMQETPEQKYAIVCDCFLPPKSRKSKFFGISMSLTSEIREANRWNVSSTLK